MPTWPSGCARSFPTTVDDATVAALVPFVRERMVRLGDVTELVGFLAEPDEVVAGWWSADQALPKGRSAVDTAEALASAHAALVDAEWQAEALEAAARTAAEAVGWKAGDFFKPIRLAVTGRAVSPAAVRLAGTAGPRAFTRPTGGRAHEGHRLNADLRLLRDGEPVRFPILQRLRSASRGFRTGHGDPQDGHRPVLRRDLVHRPRRTSRSRSRCGPS